MNRTLRALAIWISVAVTLSTAWWAFGVLVSDMVDWQLVSSAMFGWFVTGPVARCVLKDAVKP